MTGQVSSTARPRAAMRGAGVVLAMVAAASLVGCSSVPDAVNPVEWYRGAKGWVAGDEEKAKEAEEKPVPGADKDFPKLSTVPERPRVSTEAERERAAERLAADRERARYTDRQIRLQTDTATRPPPPTPRVEKPMPAPEVEPLPAPPAPPPPPAVSPEPADQSSAATPPVSSAAGPGRQVAEVPPAPSPSTETAAVSSPPVQLAGGTGSDAPAPQRVEPLPVEQPQMTPPPQVAPPTVSGGTAQVPGGAMTFGPPPRDIAALQQGQVAPRVGAAPQGASAQSGFHTTRSRFSPRFPAGVNAGFSSPGTAAGAASGPVIATVLFGVGSADIDSAARGAIRQAVDRYRARGGTLHVVGHASSRTRNMAPVSHHMVNFQVSVDRANAVARELVRQGVDRNAIVVTAVSDAEPKFFEVMPAGEAGNRRAVIMLTN